VLSESELEELHQGVERRVREAVEFADASPEPELDSLYDHLYVLGEQVPGWYAVDERTPEPHPGEDERAHSRGEVQRLAEAGAAYGGQSPVRTKPTAEPSGNDEPRADEQDEEHGMTSEG
jgi:hypothetical protein